MKGKNKLQAGKRGARHDGDAVGCFGIGFKIESIENS